ncbi:hypothetical protein SAMN04488074_113169 [Lentzea albidocapillata subsp. violacea]|uniref:Uncharacterized protein n=1 Tax=Lentzea albidocapillata subsp. violacea TaxID=128104 RepID=A0A1G9MXV8_9PSEU|nr:hypothetical protein [Lentzea albidocapillata]SDL79100.1 hypothetical protein SAMN04488074_113169 [Lentzea albidocapillata subsp. violacea]
MITRLLTVATLVAATVAVPGGAHAAPAPFQDDFDGAVAADPTYGLNDNLKQRQGTGAVTYSRVSGRWNTGDVPRPWYAQVNHPNHRGKLSMHLGTTAVRLDAPSTGSSISATLTPVAGDRTSGDWSSIALARSANSWGYVSNQDIDLGFLVRANGGVQVFQAGQSVANLPSFASPKSDGSFDVTLTPAGSTLDLLVNGTRKTITLGTAVPTDRLWIYLGRYSDNGSTVSLVDDLRIERMNSDDLRKLPGSQLRYYGYFGARLNAAGGNHLPEVRGRSNLNLVQISDFDAYRPEVLRDCAPAGCVVHTGNEFFDCDAAGCPLHPNAAERWEVLAAKVRPYLDRVAGFVLQDEPFHHGARFADVEFSAQRIKNTFPDKKVMLIEAGIRVDDTFTVPAAVDWVGFDEYCIGYEALDARMTKLAERAPGKELFLLPEAAPQSWCAGRTDADLESTQYLYLALARQHPAFVGIMVFGPWTGVGPAATGPGTPVPSKFPRTTEAQERVAALVLGDARLLG